MVIRALVCEKGHCGLPLLLRHSCHFPIRDTKIGINKSELNRKQKYVPIHGQEGWYRH